MVNSKVADVVKSTAGRDKDKYFVVVDIIDENFLFVADGNLRKIDNPKKKRRKHLKATGLNIEYIEEKISSKQKLTNADIRKNLEAVLIETNLNKEGFNG